MTLSVGFYNPPLHRCPQVFYFPFHVLCTLVSKARRHNRMRTIADTRTSGQGSLVPRRAHAGQHVSAHSKKHRVSTTDETWRQISKPEQPNGPSLQHCKESCRRPRYGSCSFVRPSVCPSIVCKLLTGKRHWHTATSRPYHRPAL